MSADSVFDAFARSAARFAERPFLRSPGTATERAATYTYAETAARVGELIPGYAARELGVGDRVALAFDSRLEVYLHLLALNALGVSIVPLSSAATDTELEFLIAHSDARLLVAAPEHIGRLTKFASCDVIGETALGGDGRQVQPATTAADTEAALLYTSGTTGKPKGCMLSNEYFLAIADWYNGLGGICALDENDRLLTPLPPNHMNALCTSFMAMLRCGGCVIQLDRFHPATWWSDVRETGATIIHYLGVMPAILLRQDPDRKSVV